MDSTRRPTRDGCLFGFGGRFRVDMTGNNELVEMDMENERPGSDRDFRGIAERRNRHEVGRRHQNMLKDISNNLVLVCEAIIEDQQTLQKSNVNEYSKNGKKYKLTSEGNFIRVQGEDKHLIVAESYGDFKRNYSILSSFHILQNCGSILTEYRKLALAIIFTSREIELNKWYDESSKVCFIENSSYDPLAAEDEALKYISNIDQDTRSQLVYLGCMILTATKINFFQTDHNVTSPTLEGYALRRIIAENCGEDALTSVDVYNALRAFSHWCSIRGIFHKLEIPNLQIDDLLIHRFKSFHQIPAWIKDTVYGRYPAGCSKLALLKKALVVVSNSVYGQLVTVPKELNVEQLLKLCKDIESDPLRYHIRAGSLFLSTNPHLEASKLLNNSDKWLEYISCLLQAIGSYHLPCENKLIISNKILKINKIKDKKVYKQTCALVNKIKSLEHSEGRTCSEDELLALLGGPVSHSLFSLCKF